MLSALHSKGDQAEKATYIYMSSAICLMRRSSVTISSDSRPFRFYGVQPRRLGTHSETLKCTVCALAGKRRTMHQFLLALKL